MALVHDWLTGMRGGEKCLKALCELFPEAEVFTLFHVPGTVDTAVESRVVRSSFLQSLPALKKYYRYLLPLFPMAVEGLDLSGHDPVVSVSHCVAKGAIPAPNSRHVCYCLTPMRYSWDLFPLYFGTGRQSRLPEPVTRVVAHYLRLWDIAASSRVDTFVAVSKFVAARIRNYYRRRATVIYPPVDWDRFKPSPSARKDYYLVVAPEAPNKRIDLVLEAFSVLGRPLKIAGGLHGRDRGRCREGDPGNVQWLGWVSDGDLADLYAHCRALVFPGLEDFGIVPVEAQAAGRPVIAYGAGGVLESVRGIPAGDVPGFGKKAWGEKGPTGIFFSQPSARALADAVECFEAVENRFEPDRIRQWARRFDRDGFGRKWRRLLRAGDKTPGGHPAAEP